MRGGRRRAAPEKGEDSRFAVEVSFEEAAAPGYRFGFGGSVEY